MESMTLGYAPAIHAQDALATGLRLQVIAETHVALNSDVVRIARHRQ
jgi:hypothetical protein